MSQEVKHQNCENEPIHIPGKIQSRGFIIAVDQQDYCIRYISDNFHPYTNSENLLDQPLAELDKFISAEHAKLKDIINVGKTNANLIDNNPYQVKFADKVFHLIISLSGDYILLEFEPVVASEDEVAPDHLLGRAIIEIQSAGNLHQMLSAMAEQIKSLIGYDRVMVYEFKEDWHGEVIAEAKEDKLEPFLGLHYPAGDIPEQARQLYKKNLTRLIDDVHSEPIEILSKSKQALDLSMADLRAVSPVHIQYLKNMGVRASFSISLIDKGELWGLIACHHTTPKYINYNIRKICRLIAQLLSTTLEHKGDHEEQAEIRERERKAEALRSQMQQDWNIVEALVQHPITLLDVNTAHGAALVYNGKIYALGNTPGDKHIHDIVDWLATVAPRHTYDCMCLADQMDGAVHFSPVASGLLVGVLSNELKEYILWFRPEQVTQVHWAGMPDKQITTNETGVASLSPRRSFERWTEIVKNCSEGWSDSDRSIARKLVGETIYIINKKANEIRKLNDQLREAYEELDTFSYTISHDLKTPLTAIRGFMEIFLQEDIALTEDQTFLLHRVVSNAEKMTEMIEDVLNYSKIRGEISDKEQVDLHGMLNDIFSDVEAAYPTKNIHLNITEPLHPVSGNALMLNQVFNNLIENAVKYSQNEQVNIEVQSKQNRTEIVYVVTDNGMGIEKSELTKIFNLFYRLNAGDKNIGSGIGLAIVKRIIDKHGGKIWVESEVGEGSKFNISLPIT